MAAESRARSALIRLIRPLAEDVSRMKILCRGQALLLFIFVVPDDALPGVASSRNGCLMQPVAGSPHNPISVSPYKSDRVHARLQPDCNISAAVFRSAARRRAT